MEVDKPEEEGAWRDEEDWKVSPECSTCLVNNGNGKRTLKARMLGAKSGDESSNTSISRHDHYSAARCSNGKQNFYALLLSVTRTESWETRGAASVC
jgi:hypothetical protein